jgi:hypothetical protein
LPPENQQLISPLRYRFHAALPPYATPHFLLYCRSRHHAADAERCCRQTLLFSLDMLMLPVFALPPPIDITPIS